LQEHLSSVHNTTQLPIKRDERFPLNVILHTQLKAYKSDD